jgi:glycosyltransferase involved in cell wall biosynthesis
MNPLVSVNLTTYNRAGLLPRALDSVLSQSLSDLEVVVVDDCSPDATAAVVAAYREGDDRVKYYRHETNHGNARARNTALANCRGEFVAFMDDDDEWIDPDKLAKQVAILRADSKVGIVCSSVRRCTSETDSVDWIVSKPVDLKSRILSGNGIIFSPTVMTRRSIMHAIGGFDEKMVKGVDSEFFRRCIVKYGYDVHFMPEITTAVHEYGAVRMTPVRNRYQAKRALSAHWRVLRKYFRHYLHHPRALGKRLKSIVILLPRMVWRP